MNSKRVLLLIALSVILFALCAPLATAQGDGDTVYRATLIGNENYSSNTLEGCIVDVNRMLNALQAANEAGGRYQSPVTRTNLKASEMKALVSDMQNLGVDSDDVTLLFYAGLGAVTDDGVCSLTGRDGEAVMLSDLRTMLDQLLGTKIVVLDVRYLEAQAQKSKLSESQLLSAFNQAVTDAFRGGTTQQRYQVLTSATMLKSIGPASAALGTPCGLFSYYLVQGCGYDYKEQRSGDLMADANMNGAVSMAEARDYVLSGIANLAKEQDQKIQNSIMIYPEDGSFPLLSKRAMTEILSISLDKPAVSIAAGKTDQLNATVQPINVRQKSVSWISSDMAVATVDRDGVVKGIRPGQAVITAMTPNGMTTECKVLIRDVTFAQSVSISASKLVVGNGKELVLTLTMVPQSSNEMVNWKSNDVSVASVSENGVVQTMRIGSAVITATTETGKEVSCVVQVVDPASVVSEVSVDAKSLSIYEGEARLLSAKVKPARAADPMIVWSSSDEKIAQVESNGLVAGVGPGTAVITATASSGTTATVDVSVKGATIIFKKNQVTLKKGKKVMLKWDVQPAGAVLDIQWDSSDPDVATVTESGGVEALKNGETAITASLSNGMKAICRVSVASITAKSITLDKQKLSLTVGDQRQISGRVAPANASIKTITWRSSDDKIAMVDDTGMITATGVGKVSIVGRTHNSKKAKCELTVKPVSVSSISLSSAEESFMLGVDEPLQLSASVEPAPIVGNAALKWTSSNKKVASVDQSGLVTPKGAGTAVIVASSGKVKANCKVTVGVNRTLHKKPTVGKGKQVYASLRQVSYSGDQLVVQMYFVNRTKKAAKIPQAGMLTLTLATGETYELVEVAPDAKRKLNPGKTTVLSYKIEVSSNENLKGLDLRGAKVEIVAADAPVVNTPEAENTPDDGLMTTGAV